MNVFADQLSAHENEVEVLRKIRRESLANKIPGLFAGTQVNCFGLSAITNPDTGNVQLLVSVGDEHLKEGDSTNSYNPEHTFHDRGYCDFDLAENGNAGVREFLKLDIEWHDMVAIVNQVAQHFEDIIELFHLIPDNNQVVFSGGKYWVTANDTTTEAIEEQA